MSNRYGRLTVAVVSLSVLVTAGVFTAGASAAGRHDAKPALKLIHKGELVFGTDASYPPMESVDSSTNQIVGADIGLGKAIAKVMGLKAVFENITFGTLLNDMLIRHNMDVAISSMNDTPSRRSYCASAGHCGVSFVDYLKAVEAIVVKKGSNLHANNYSQICGWSISVQSATTEEIGLKAANAHCKKKINITEFPTDTLAFQDFTSGHVQSYTTDYPVAAKYIKNHPTEFQLAGNVMKTGQFYGIASPKSNAGLHNAIMAAFAKVKKSGQYLRILKKWNVQGGAI
ncbi:MAG TPA: ABC transporter substrate-binding protein [Chloroflexota bacterium]|jgi:polar amino acid transport system substrate-binding protein|nr:ABC transporter substrate-binding protein [Chloroflexota bacterium]